ncbi:hypothetical protein [Psychrobacter pacificensis]|uniref:hypothetical protein n=1 Tax=Psychrobacter pacificensis TaxID=112002 RepID=UPI0011600273|nr:hypothetical protein [Psychrobacter pacificensis]
MTQRYYAFIASQHSCDHAPKPYWMTCSIAIKASIFEIDAFLPILMNPQSIRADQFHQKY